MLTKLCKTCNSEFLTKRQAVCCSKQCKLIYKRKYLVIAVSNRRRKIKEMAINYKGGKCQICSYDKFDGALEFHHLDPTQKDFHISKNGHSRSWKRVKAELDKCILVCATCHREIHGGLHPAIGFA